MSNILQVNPKNCNGCKECEIVCSSRQSDIHNPPYPRIQVIQGDSNGRFFLPTTCQHCDDPPCKAVCENSAIFRDNELNRVVVDSNKCVGCKMCVSACPFGAMGFDKTLGFAFKCDLCDGAPECVRVCKPGALEYIDGSRLNYTRMTESAVKHYAVLRNLIS